MENNTAENTDIFDIQLYIKKYWPIIKKEWKTIMWVTIAGFVIGSIIALTTPRKYIVISKIAPELSTSTSNRLSSVASMMGLNAAMIGSTDAVYPLVYPDVVQSPDFIAELFNTPVSFEYKKERIDTTLYAYMSDYRKKSLIGTVLSLPGRAVGTIVNLFKSENEEDDYISSDGKIMVNPFHFTKKQGRIYKSLLKSIDADIDKKTFVVSIKVEMDNPLVCATISQAVMDNLKETITKYRTQKAIEERNYFQGLFEKARSDYFDAQWRYSEYVDAHQNMILQSVQVEKERLKNETNLLFQVYNNFATQLQSANAKIQQDTPAFAEIVKPTVPLIPVNSKIKIIFSYTFIFFLGGVIYFIYNEWRNNQKRKD